MKLWEPEIFTPAQRNQMKTDELAEVTLYNDIYEAYDKPLIEDYLYTRDYWLNTLVNQNIYGKDRPEDYPMKDYFQPILKLSLELMNDKTSHSVLSKKICISVLKQVRQFFVRYRQFIMEDRVQDFEASKKLALNVLGYVDFILYGNPHYIEDVVKQMQQQMQLLRENSKLMALCRMVRYYFKNSIETNFNLLEESKFITAEMRQCYTDLSTIIADSGYVVESAYRQNNNDNNNNDPASLTQVCLNSFDIAMTKVFPGSCTELLPNHDIVRRNKKSYIVLLTSLEKLMTASLQDASYFLDMIQNNGFDLKIGDNQIMRHLHALYEQRIHTKTRMNLAENSLSDIVQWTFQLQKIQVLMRVIIGLNVWPEDRLVNFHCGRLMADLWHITKQLIDRVTNCAAKIHDQYHNTHPEYIDCFKRLKSNSPHIMNLQQQLNGLRKSCLNLAFVSTSQLINHECEHTNNLLHTMCDYYTSEIGLSLPELKGKELVKKMLCDNDPKCYFSTRSLGYRHSKQVCSKEDMFLITKTLSPLKTVNELDLVGLNMTPKALKELVKYLKSSKQGLMIEKIDMTNNPLICSTIDGVLSIVKLIKTCTNLKTLVLSECALTYANAYLILGSVINSSIISVNLGQNPNIGKNMLKGESIPTLLDMIKKSTCQLRDLRLANVGMKGRGYQALLDLIIHKESIISYCIDDNEPGYDDIKKEILKRKERNLYVEQFDEQFEQQIALQNNQQGIDDNDNLLVKDKPKQKRAQFEPTVSSRNQPTFFNSKARTSLPEEHEKKQRESNDSTENNSSPEQAIYSELDEYNHSVQFLSTETLASPTEALKEGKSEEEKESENLSDQVKQTADRKLDEIFSSTEELNLTTGFMPNPLSDEGKAYLAKPLNRKGTPP